MSEFRFSGKVLVSEATKEKLWALMERNGFKNLDEAISFLLEFYETATRRRLLLKEVEG